MKKTLFILVVLLVAGCSPEKRLSRLIEKYPHLVSTDTIFNEVSIVTEKTKIDTLFSIKTPPPDTLIIERNKTRLKLKIDTLYKTIYASAECLPDTITISVPTEVKTVKVKHESIKEFVVLCFVLAILFLLFLISKNLFESRK